MNVLIWATTFGGDLWSLARFLDNRPEVRLRIVLDDPHTFSQQGVARLFPLKAEIVERRWYHNLPSKKWDITILDNGIPLFRTSRTALILWHGFGWKGPNDEKELWLLHSWLRRTWGDIRRPNPNLVWQAFGPWDFKHRTEISAVHPDNCRILGAASHDDLIKPIDRAKAQPYYPFDVIGKKTVLIAPTWHYGEVFAHWGRDAELLNILLTHIDQLGANTIMRLHDLYRFDSNYLEFLKGLPKRHSNLVLKFKDKAPDNFLDMQVSDVLITNFSSIANLFYATRRPTIHVYPVKNADESFMRRTLRWSGVRKKQIDKARYIWKLPPEDNGGLLAHTFDQLLEQLDLAITDPTCCVDASNKFLKKHMLGADSNSCQRIWDTMVDLAGR